MGCLCCGPDLYEAEALALVIVKRVKEKYNVIKYKQEV